MNKYDVIIIDSGIDKKHECFRSVTIDAKQIVYDINEALVVSEQHNYTYGHGTAMASIISNGNSGISILSINILHSDYETDENTLLCALRYVLDNCLPTVINMSLGITACEDKNQLYCICTELVDRGFVLLSAFDNDGMFAFPASFDVVIGVRSSEHIFMADEYEMYSDAVVNIGGFGRLQRVAWTDNRYMLLGGNSFACANITRCLLHNAQNAQISFKEAMGILKAHAKSYEDVGEVSFLYRNSKLPFNIQRAVIFPFNKEMHSLLRFEYMLPFQICDVYESKYSMKVGGYTDRLLNDSRIKSLKIKNIEDISFEGIDTIVIGHMSESLQFPNMREIYKSLIEKIKQNNTNVYSFDDLRNEQIEKYYFPYVSKEDMPMRRFGMQYKISKPVLGIFGTSSKQGKFTLQLSLRKYLQERGYKVGQIGTEPSSLLFGMDDVFPIGYESKVEIAGMDSVIYLNNQMERIANKDNDIIMVGCQSGTVTYELNNVANCCLGQYEFLLGTQPDIVFVCVNPFDEEEYINRTISFIESSVDCKVIGVVVFPMTRKKDWTGNFGQLEQIPLEKYDDLKRRFFESTHKKVFILGNEEDYEDMVDTLIDELSEE